MVKPTVAIVKIAGKRLKHPIEARVVRATKGTCAYCRQPYTGARYSWVNHRIGQVETTYTGCCLDCAEVEEDL